MSAEACKWFWMMKYCREKQIPCAQPWAWDEAEKVYQKHIKESK